MDEKQYLRDLQVRKANKSIVLIQLTLIRFWTCKIYSKS
jgi:hypothetical protein